MKSVLFANNYNATATNSQFAELFLYSRSLLITAGICILVIMIIGIFGNLLTVIALLRNAKLRTVAAAFIASLCISDLMLCFLVCPFAASHFFQGTWIHGETLCTMIPMLRYGAVGVSLLSIATISLNRYILICWPQIYPTIFSKWRVAVYVAFIWAFSYGIQVPTLLGQWGNFGYDTKLGTCTIRRDALTGRSPKTTLFVMGFALPCIVIVVCYTRIYWVVRMSRLRVSQHQDAMRRRSEMRITHMVMVIFLCFIVCYLPITVVKTVDADVRYAPLHVLGYILVYCSSCVNPVVYVTMNRQYRQAYMDTLRWGACMWSEKMVFVAPSTHSTNPTGGGAGSRQHLATIAFWRKSSPMTAYPSGNAPSTKS